MDNLISGLIGMVIFLAFIIGLAESIGEAPFIAIVAIVSCMAFFDYFQSAREGLQVEKHKKTNGEAANGQ